ncbi:signal peptidase I [Candidatus Woesearchaeota archaeon]|nr:signal peptidase I [Candidatus Woesearchaeota archaeon]
MNCKEIKRIWSKIWFFIWEDNSIWSWIINIILAFVIIKFLVYPGLGFVLGTTHPIVAVVSSSMEHPEGNFDDWWARTCGDGKQKDVYSKSGISKSMFLGFDYHNGFNKGDIMLLSSSKNIEIGDIIVFITDRRPEPIIHRVIEAKAGPNDISCKTKGDNNCGSADFEQNIENDTIIGKALFRVPLLGWIKIGFVELLKLVRLT